MATFECNAVTRQMQQVHKNKFHYCHVKIVHDSLSDDQHARSSTKWTIIALNITD